MSHALVIGHDTHASLRRLAPWFAEYGLDPSYSGRTVFHDPWTGMMRSSCLAERHCRTMTSIIPGFRPPGS